MPDSPILEAEMKDLSERLCPWLRERSFLCTLLSQGGSREANHCLPLPWQGNKDSVAGSVEGRGGCSAGEGHLPGQSKRAKDIQAVTYELNLC